MAKSAQTSDSDNSRKSRLDQSIQTAIEAVVLLLVVISPWAFGSVEDVSKFGISIGLGILLILWAVRLSIRATWERKGNGVLCCLGCFVLLSVLQLVSLPASAHSLISPGSSETWRFFLPPEPEVSPGESASTYPSEHSLSISPFDTRQFLTASIALCVLFAVVINNLMYPGTFVRLAWAAVVNGTLLSLLGFAQLISSSPHTVYWSIETDGSVFGPFVCRNHFGFYINVCIGLGLGLLAASLQKYRRFLDDPKSIWLMSMLAVMATAVTFSLSRGGLLALIGAASLGSVLWLRQRRTSRRSLLLLSLVPIVLIAGSLIGWSAVEKRFSVIASDPSIREGRLQEWRDTSRLIPSFLWLGTGNGTYELVEPLERRPAGEELHPVDFAVTNHAHNEYFEALVEGGLPRLAATIVLAVLVIVGGLRTFRALSSRTIGWLTLGGLIGIWAVAIQSAVDWGMHIPAVALLVTVVAAHVIGARVNNRAKDVRKVPRAVAFCLAIPMVLLALLLVWEGYRNDRSKRFRNAAAMLLLSPNAESSSQAIRYLEEAVRIRPDSPRFHYELGQAHLVKSQHTDSKTSAESQIRDALRHWRIARDLCPLESNAQARLGSYRQYFAHSQSAIWYFERARRSFPTDPTIWFVLGQARLNEGDLTGAWSDWRQSLTLSGFHLPAVLKQAGTRLTPAELVEKVLPDRANVVDAAKRQLFPDAKASAAERMPFLMKALALLERRGAERTAAEEVVLGQTLRELNRPAEALAAFQRSVEKDRNSNVPRWEMGWLLMESERFEEALVQFKAIAAREPWNQEAKHLVDVAEREILLSEP